MLTYRRYLVAESPQMILEWAGRIGGTGQEAPAGTPGQSRRGLSFSALPSKRLRITCSLSVGKCDFDPQKIAGHLIFLRCGQRRTLIIS